MKKTIPLILILAAIVFGCSKKNIFVVEGKITNAGEKYIYLDELKLTTTKLVDSVQIDKNGNFKFKGSVHIPTFFLLRLTNNNFITLLVDSVDKVKVSADAANFSRQYLVSGSEGSKLVQELNEHLNTTKHKLDSIRNLNVLYRNRANYQEIKKTWDIEYNFVMKQQMDYSIEFVNKHPFSMASVLALYQKFDDNNFVIQDLQSLKVAASALNSVFPRSEHVQALYANTIRLMQGEKNTKLKKLIAEKGQNSPDIILPNPEGKKIALSSTRGKYVLLQFWASGDQTSRIQNPVLVELYQKYRGRKFEIYQVSVDTDRYDWVNAINKDGLNWINVGDMMGSNLAVNTYNIQNIPSNYLLDPEGNIIAKDIQGPSLNQLLGKILR